MNDVGGMDDDDDDFNYSSFLLSNNRSIDRIGTYRKGDGANKGDTWFVILQDSRKHHITYTDMTPNV
jgi:hypothetical protein